MIYEPRNLFSVIWSVQLIAYFIVQNLFGSTNLNLILIIVSVVSFFSFGCYLAKKMFQVPQHSLSNLGNLPSSVNLKELQVSTAIAFSFIATAIVLGTLYLLISTGFPSYAELRDLIIFDISDERHLTWYGNLQLIGIGFCVFAISLYSFNTKIQIAYVVLGITFSALSTGRIGLLLLSLSTFFLLSRQNKLTGARTLILGSLLVGVFLGVAYFLDKGVENDDLGLQLVWNVTVYAFGGVGAFDHFLTTGEPIIDGSALLPGWARTILIGIGFNLNGKEAFLPYVGFPLPTNVYTAFFSYYHDLGIGGLLLVFLFYGFMHQAIYEKFGSSTNPFAQYFFCISIFPLCMTFFDDVYFVSIGFWLSLMFPIILIYIVLNVRAFMQDRYCQSAL